MIKYRKRLTFFPSHVTTQLKCKSTIKNPWLFPKTRARTSKKPNTRRILMVTRSSASTMIIPWSLRTKWLRSVRPAQWEPLQKLHRIKSQRRIWSHPLTNKKKPWSTLTKNQKRRSKPNRRPNLVIKRILPAKLITCGTVSDHPPLKETFQLRSNAKNISEPLTRISRMQNRMRNVSLEKSQSGPAPTRWCTSTNSNEFTFSTMPESWQRHRPSKQINSTKSAAQPWVKKRRQWLAFSKQSAPMMTWHPTKNDQSHTTSL